MHRAAAHSLNDNITTSGAALNKSSWLSAAVRNARLELNNLSNSEKGNLCAFSYSTFYF